MVDRPIVLVVDDEERIRSMIGELLTDGGYNVLLASSGDVAYDIVQATPIIDLIVTDVRMPGLLNGFDLLEQVHARRPGIRAIVMSGFTGEANTRFGLAQRYLRKPFTMTFFEEQVREVLAA